MIAAIASIAAIIFPQILTGHSTLESVLDLVQYNDWISIKAAGILDKKVLETNNRTPLRNKTGSWLGNSWIPPAGWHSYSLHELQELYDDKSMLWIGDSTARRAAMTLYALLNASNHEKNVPVHALDSENVLDVNKGGNTREPCPLAKHNAIHKRTSICRPMPNNSNKWFIYANKLCTGNMLNFFQSELSGESNITALVDIIVVSYGIWELVQANACQAQLPETPYDILEHLNATLSLLDILQQQTGKTILWRTSGFDERATSPSNVSFIRTMNELVMDRIDEIADYHSRMGIQSNLTYVHFGGAIEPRSFEKDRILGDRPAHYGLEPRLALIQMVTNRLKELQYHVGVTNVRQQGEDPRFNSRAIS